MYFFRVICYHGPVTNRCVFNTSPKQALAGSKRPKIVEVRALVNNERKQQNMPYLISDPFYLQPEPSTSSNNDLASAAAARVESGDFPLRDWWTDGLGTHPDTGDGLYFDPLYWGQLFQQQVDIIFIS